MIIFRQKQYISTSPDNYESTIINTGGVNGSTPKQANQLVPSTENISAQISGQLELSRQKTIQNRVINQIRMDRNQGLKDRGEDRRNMHVASMTQAKKQASVIGIQNAREIERKKNSSYITPYKSPTKSLTPIPTSKTMRRR